MKDVSIFWGFMQSGKVLYFLYVIISVSIELFSLFSFQGADCEYRHSEIARLNPRDCWYWLSGDCVNPTCAFRHPVRFCSFIYLTFCLYVG